MLNCKFKAIYQDKDWLISQVKLGKDAKTIAKELGVTKRVIQKWLHEKNRIFFRNVYKLTPLQRQVIIWGTLGDGHIDKRENQSMYIESHTIDEKDYLFWKYELLKPMFNNPPTFYKGKVITHLNNKAYQCKDYYRMSSKVVDDLVSIRDMDRIEKIKTLDELGLSLYMLDDGSRGKYTWELCLAMFSDEEKEYFLNECKKKFDINGRIMTDNRYVGFDSKSSLKIDEIILRNIPNELDIIKKKIYKYKKDIR